MRGGRADRMDPQAPPAAPDGNQEPAPLAGRADTRARIGVVWLPEPPHGSPDAGGEAGVRHAGPGGALDLQREGPPARAVGARRGALERSRWSSDVAPRFGA